VADAAELAGHALRLIAAGDSEYDGRLLALAQYLIDAGEHPRAAGLLAGRISAMSAGPPCAAAYLLLAEGADYRAGEEYLARASPTAPRLRGCERRRWPGGR
jgi:hypothetical protein